MLTEHQANGTYLEHPYYEIVGEVYQTIHTSGLYSFTLARIDSLWKDLESILYDLDHLSELELKALMEVIEYLRESRNELRLACFLFDVVEINPVHRLLMRNRAVLRSEKILTRALRAWPSGSS